MTNNKHNASLLSTVYDDEFIKKVQAESTADKEAEKDWLYHAAFDEGKRNENDTELEHLARTILENKFDGITETKDAVYRALELMEEMRGRNIDPTEDELSDIIYYVENPEPVRIRRGLFKAMKRGELFDYIAREYMAFRKEELADIIKELDYAFEQVCFEDDYKEALENATGELKERWLYHY